MAWHTRLLNVLRPARLRREIEREMAFHIAERVEELVAGGWSEAEAKRVAAKQFGNVLLQGERTRDADVLVWLESLVADIRYAWRGLRRTPGFTLVAVLSLGLGIGATTAIFSLIEVVMLRPLAVPRPEQLVQMIQSDGSSAFTNPLWEAIREHRVLGGVFAYGGATFDLAEGGEVRRVDGHFVSGTFFSVLGIPAAAGRLFGRADDVRGCAATAVLSHAFWQREYGGATDAVGRNISLNGRRFEIIGVTGEGFTGLEVGEAAQVYAPVCTIEMLEGPGVLDLRSRMFLKILGRLGSDQTLEQASARLAPVARAAYAGTVPAHWGSDNQAAYRKTELSLRSAKYGLSSLRQVYRQALFVLFAVAGVVLLVACVNIANLLLARSAGRRHEMAVRRAIGCGRGRLIRQLITESLLLSFLGAAIAILLAPWASRLIVRMLSATGDVVWLDLSLNGGVLAFMTGVAVLTGVAFGLAPALRTSREPAQSALRSGRSRALASAGLATGKALVIAQLALSLTLVTAAGLLQGSFWRLVTLDPGFEREGVLVVRAHLRNAHGPDVDVRRAERQILERLRALPGVRSASAAIATPIGSMTWNETVSVDGDEATDRASALVYMNTVSEDYFATLGIALLAGRDFHADDTEGATRVALINRTMAQRFFGDPNSLGRHFRIVLGSGPGPAFEVVGVVEDSKYETLAEAPRPLAWFPLDQGPLFGNAIDYQLRGEGSPLALVPGVKDVFAQVDPGISLEITTLAAQVSATLARPRLLAALSGVFGTLALLLAVIGLYGTISYAVARRRSEIAMRLALGAAPAGVLRMILAEVGVLTVAGVLLGAPAAFASTRLLTAFLYGVSATDPVTLAVSVTVLVSVVLPAGLLPAWKAARLDPMRALREE